MFSRVKKIGPYEYLYLVECEIDLSCFFGPRLA